MSRTFTWFVVTVICGCASLTPSAAQPLTLHGQASGWLAGSADEPPQLQTGLRYIPELTVGTAIAGGLNADADLSLNMYASRWAVQRQQPEGEMNVKPYRASLRLASDEFEIRAGLQKINFGTATLLRSLMWFDRIDPRDPLQLTDGVYGLLGRYYFLNNVNVWLWGLSSSGETKGWEAIPSRKHSVEYGGRVQLPLWTGELGAAYHHRETGMNIPEHRFALDGKWDVGVGLWFEGVITHSETDIPGLRYVRQWTVGVDYTCDVGNGLTALVEHYRADAPETPLASADGRMFSALSLTSPFGLFDRLSCVIYRDWEGHEWYRILTWQRTYDDWVLYLIGYWNPRQIQLYTTTAGNTSFAGRGIQLMVVVNH